MKSKRYTDEQIAYALRPGAAAVPNGNKGGRLVYVLSGDRVVRSFPLTPSLCSP